MRKLQVKLILFVSKKLNEINGESHTMAIIGWSATAIFVVIAVYNMLPDKVVGFINGIFTKLSTGLNI